MNAKSSSAIPAVYTIAPGVDFLGALASRLLREAKDMGDPRDLGAMRVFLPTQRAARALERLLLEVSGERALLLPQIIPLGGAGELEQDEDFDWHGSNESPLPCLLNSERQFLLTRLILHWSERSDSRIAGSPAQAAQLALELGDLLDAFETENVNLEKLRDLVPDSYAENWQETLEFLKIISEGWPEILKERGCISQVAGRDNALRDIAKRWEKNPPQDLVIAAGSTGSIPATAKLLGCISRLPKGMVVLPGLDKELKESVWKRLGWEHPQYAMKRLLGHIKIERKDVRVWEDGVEESSAQEDRRHLLRLAFYPAEAIGGWQDALTSEKDLSSKMRDALTGLDLLEAPGRREEAGMIALLLREVLETPGKRGALVTPDRELARWVCGEMRRWGVEIDDSAGSYLSESEEMRFARLLGEAVEKSLAPTALLALLKHPLTRLGMERSRLRHSIEMLEIHLLRGLPPPSGISGLRFQIQQAKQRKRKPLSDSQAKEIEAFLDILQQALAPLKSAATGERHLKDWLEAHMLTLEAFAAEDLSALLDFFETLLRDGTALPELSFSDYLALIAQLSTSKRIAPTSARAHPRIFIWGALEARFQRVDLMILGGLNEGVWPTKSHVDPWLNRAMLKQLKLNDPEWRIGHGAHDFVQGAMQPEVVLSRALKVDGAPTMKSRWLLRLETLLRGMKIETIGEQDFSGKWLAHFQSLDNESKDMIPAPCSAPMPCPPLEARPKKFSVTRIERLIEDPYEIFARNILFLEPLDPIEAEFDARLRGSLLHEVLEDFSREWNESLPDDIAGAFLKIAAEKIAPLREAKPETAALLWPSIEVLARHFAMFESERRSTGMRLLVESHGHISFDLNGEQHELTCIADRIEIAKGGAVICDYKSGTLPEARDVLSGRRPQLSLEAVILREGGFEECRDETLRLDGLAYISARAREELGAELPLREIVPKEENLDAFINKTETGLKHLLTAYLDAKTPYPYQPRRDRRSYAGDYAHLARLLEWSSSAEEV